MLYVGLCCHWTGKGRPSSENPWLFPVIQEQTRLLVPSFPKPIVSLLKQHWDFTQEETALTQQV